MASGNTLKAKTLALSIAIRIGGGAAAAVRADEMQDLKAQVDAVQQLCRQRVLG